MGETSKTKKELREEKRKEANRKVVAENMRKRQEASFDENGKVITSYDKKVQERKRQEKKDRRNVVIARIFLWAVLAAAAAGIIFVTGMKLYGRFGTAITVNGEKIGRIEYDFYYNMTVNNFLNTYGSYASYMGLDVEKDFSKQKYQDDKTWEDYFNDGAVSMLKQIKALSAEADNASFEYDEQSRYDEFNKSIEEAASKADTRLSKYYKDTFGEYASRGSLEKYVKQYLRGSEYLEDYSKKLTFTDAQKDKYYEEHKDTYDVVDFRYLEVDDENKANEMLEAVTDGDSFKSLCEQYAADDVKKDYTSGDKSLNTKVSKSSIDLGNDAAEWIFDSSREEGDKTVIESSSKETSYVIYFVNRYLTDEKKKTMEDAMRDEKSGEFLDEKTKDMTVSGGTVRLKNAG